MSEEFRLRSIALTAYGPSSLAAIGYGATAAVLPLLARDLGASVHLAATVIGLAALGPLVGSLPAGALVARVGERRALVAAGIVVFVGGIIPDEDMDALREMGITAVFGPGASLDDVIASFRQAIAARHAGE